MADGKNDARALRILEIMNDYNTLQRHIAVQCARFPPDPASASAVGWPIFQQCRRQAQALLARPFNPGNTGIPSDFRNIPNTDIAKVNLQRIILDASSRRFQAHTIYLHAAAASRWCQLRDQVLKSPQGDQQRNALQRLDQRLAEELRVTTDGSVYSDLRRADQRKHYWLDDDPLLDGLLAWIRSGN